MTPRPILPTRAIRSRDPAEEATECRRRIRRARRRCPHSKEDCPAVYSPPRTNFGSAPACGAAILGGGDRGAPGLGKMIALTEVKLDELVGHIYEVEAQQKWRELAQRVLEKNKLQAIEADSRGVDGLLRRGGVGKGVHGDRLISP